MPTLPELIRSKQEARNTFAGRMEADRKRQLDMDTRYARGEVRIQAGLADEQEKNQHDNLRNQIFELATSLNAAPAQLQRMDEELIELKAEQRADEEIHRKQHISVPGASLPDARSDREVNVFSTVRVGAEPRMYSAERSEAGETSFLRDLFNAQIRNDPEAMGRLQRHGEEQRVEAPGLVERAVSTSGVAAFTPPSYLIGQWAELARAGRPIADLCNRGIPLPATGMEVSIPRITTGAAVGVQAAEGDTLANQDLDDTDLRVPIVSIGGYVDVRWQALDRGQLVEMVTFADLAADYGAKTDQQVIYGTGADGQARGILATSGVNATTFTDTTPTLVEMYSALSSTVGKVTSTRFAGATAIAMTPTLWYWMRGQLGTDNRPLIPDVDAGPVNAFGSGGSVEYVQTAGKLFVPVVLDGNIPTNLGGGTETAIIAANWSDLFLMEEQGGAPTQLRFEIQPKSATATLVAFGYMAFTAGRQPKAVSKLTGTGLAGIG